MIEKELRDILRDWITEIGITIVERDNNEYANADVYVLKGDAQEDYDAYDRAMTFAEKRLGLTLPTSVDAHDLLFEYVSKIWLCGRVLAREVGNLDIENKRLSQIFQNIVKQKNILVDEYKELRQEVWGTGLSNRRTTTGDLEIVTLSVVSDTETQIENKDVLEL